MMETINLLIDNCDLPLVSAFLLGILTAISPCPLATNIAAIAYISKDVKTARHTLLSGLSYTLGRAVSYTLLASLIYAGFSAFRIASLFRGWGDKVLGPILIFSGLVMLGVIRIEMRKGADKLERTKFRLVKKGLAGSFLLGMLFALAFCPSSGVLFFGVLMPLILDSREGLLFAPVFSLGTGLPVIVFSFLLASSLQKVGQVFQMVQKIEKVMRYGAALVFIGVGAYYTWYLIEYLSLR